MTSPSPTVVSRSGRLAHLDAVRGIAAALVLVHHCIILLPPPFPGGVMKLLGMTPLAPLVVGQPLVIVFFVLSGLVLTVALERFSDYYTYAFRRLFRLYVPLAASVVLAFMLARAFGGRETGDGWVHWFANVPWNRTDEIDFALLLKHLVPTGRLSDEGLNTVIWSLAIELRLSLLMPLIVWAVRRWPLGAGAAAGFTGFYTEAALLGLVPGFAPRLAFGDGLFLIKDWTGTLLATGAVLPAFVLGSTLAVRRHEISSNLLTGKHFWLLTAGALVLLGLPSVVVSSAGAALLLLVLMRSPEVRSRLAHPVFLALGAISYSLYLVHFPILHAAVNLGGNLPPPLVLALGATAAVAAAVLFRIVVEKPALELARRIGRRA